MTKGGSGISIAQSDWEGLLNLADNFPKEVEKHPVPVEFTLSDYTDSPDYQANKGMENITPVKAREFSKYFEELTMFYFILKDLDDVYLNKSAYYFREPLFYTYEEVQSLRNEVKGYTDDMQMEVDYFSMGDQELVYPARKGEDIWMEMNVKLPHRWRGILPGNEMYNIHHSVVLYDNNDSLPVYNLIHGNNDFSQGPVGIKVVLAAVPNAAQNKILGTIQCNIKELDGDLSEYTNYNTTTRPVIYSAPPGFVIRDLSPKGGGIDGNTYCGAYDNKEIWLDGTGLIERAFGFVSADGPEDGRLYISKISVGPITINLMHEEETWEDYWFTVPFEDFPSTVEGWSEYR
ncbi:MAG: hypothetical protein ABIH23_22825 [bacterium]